MVGAQEMEELRVSKTFSLLRPITVTLQQGSQKELPVTFKRNTDKPLFYNGASNNDVRITATFALMSHLLSKERAKDITLEKAYKAKELQGKRLVIVLQKKGCEQGKLCLKFDLKDDKKARKKQQSGVTKKTEPSDVPKKGHMDMPIARKQDNRATHLMVRIVHAGVEEPHSRIEFRDTVWMRDGQKRIRLPIAATTTVAQAKQDLIGYKLQIEDTDPSRNNESYISDLLGAFKKQDMKMNALAIIIKGGFDNQPDFIENSELRSLAGL